MYHKPNFSSQILRISFIYHKNQYLVVNIKGMVVILYLYLVNKDVSFTFEHPQKEDLYMFGCKIIVYYLTSVKLVTVYVLFATKAGMDLAAYFLPANATMYPPYESCHVKCVILS